MSEVYEKRLLRVLDYIHANPGADLSLDALADVAAMSRYHWHRVFAAMTGETLAEATRRVRLHRAACWLVQTDWPLAEVARKVGYTNQQSFTRIFREGYGTTPGAFRNRGELRPLLLRKDKGEYPMFPVEITTMEPRTLAAERHKGPYLEVGAAFERVSTVFTSRDAWKHATGMMGLYYDDPKAVPEAELQSHAGVVVGDAAHVPEGLDTVEVAGGRVAVMHHKGPYAGLKAAYDYLYGEWLPASGEEPRDAPAMEVYLNNPMDTAPDELLTDVCLPLK
ncbi:MAG: AraC family transcriptional regulator [Pseudomonadota bacterium]